MLKPIQFDPDRPIEDAKFDRLGFAEIAASLAKSISGNSAKKGFVVGIEGQWGSGKSSILNLLQSHLAAQEHVTVVKFDPWLIGDRDSMVATLIGDLASAIEAIKTKQGSATDKVKAEAREVARKLRAYGATTSRGLARVAQIGSLIGLPGSDTAAKALGLSGDVLGGKSAVPLAKQRAKLFKALKRLNHRFVVMVDDLDRLEPAEATEVMRLIRAVGDFPNVIYLLCYDRQVLAHSLEAALGIGNGSKFLRKVVQASFAVPRPEEFDLRRWLLSELHSLYHSVHSTDVEDPDVRERLTAVCDNEGNRLRTPRDIALILNALRLTYPPVADKIDYADMCWLQLTRILNAKLYRWVEKYLDLFAITSGGFGMASQRERERLGKKLLRRLDDPNGLSFGSMARLSQIIPGIEPPFGRDSQEPQKLVLNSVDASALGIMERSRRIGSPQHYRFYFTFSKPAGALDDAVLAQMMKELMQAADIVPQLQVLAKTPRPQGGTMYGVLLDRLQRSSLAKLDPPAKRRLVLSIADTVDDAERMQPRGGIFGQRDIWRSARNLLRSFLVKLPEQERESFIRQLFAAAKSIGWLMESLIGRELFAQGRVGEKRTQPEEWLMKSEELNLAIEALLERLAGRDKQAIIDAPDLMSFLYRWKQSGGEKELQHWVSQQIKEDDDFMILLDKCRGYRVGKRVHYPLNKRDISVLMDFENMKGRLKEIAADNSRSDEVRAKARELIEAAEHGEDYIGRAE